MSDIYDYLPPTTSYLAEWEKTEQTPEERVFKHCFHFRNTCEIIEEAEHVIVLKEQPRRYHPQGVIHVWIYLRGWSSCKTFSPWVWEKLSMPDRLEELQHRLNFLRTQLQE